mmetsp:Transcript_72380/g.189706  ORF Transcript_72380/g.189706 Transcript_72380/m.189706 type:complete len:231 (+) Transcript_72380:40-732(+)
MELRPAGRARWPAARLKICGASPCRLRSNARQSQITDKLSDSFHSRLASVQGRQALELRGAKLQLCSLKMFGGLLELGQGLGDLNLVERCLGRLHLPGLLCGLGLRQACPQLCDECACDLVHIRRQPFVADHLRNLHRGARPATGCGELGPLGQLLRVLQPTCDCLCNHVWLGAVGPEPAVNHVVNVALLLAWQEGAQHHWQRSGGCLGNGAGPGLGNNHIACGHPLVHV